MKTSRFIGAVIMFLCVLSQGTAQERGPDNPYPLLVRFLGNHRAFNATLVSVVQSEDGMVMEGGKQKYTYLDGAVRMESEFSSQWMALFALSPPDTNAIKRAGLDQTIAVFATDKKKLYLIFPNARAYCETDLPGDVHPPTEADLKIERLADGSETVDGHPCARSKVTIHETKPSAGAEEKITAVLWEAQDLNGFPVKIRARLETPMGVFTSTETFTDIKLVTPESSLFNPPPHLKMYRSMEEFSEAVQKTVATGEERRRQFWAAVERGDLEQAKSLTKQTPELLQARAKDDQTPLHVAAQAGQKEVVLWLINKKADANAQDARKSTPLHGAAAASSAPIVDILVKAGAKLEALDIDGRTPLLVAASKGSKETIEALLRAGANANASDTQGMTSLHLAAARGAKDIVADLVSHKADVSAKNKRGLTPLWEAITQGYDGVVELLVAHGADVNATGLDGQTPLSWALVNNRKAMLKTLVANKASANTYVVGRIGQDGEFGSVLFPRDADAQMTNAFRNPLLLVATAKADPELVRLVLDNGADVNAKGPAGDTALHAAASRGSLELIKLLLSHNADVNVANRDKNTPLHLAFLRGQKEAVKLLIAAHADLEACSENGMTALDYAAQNDWKDIVDLLITNGAVPCTQSESDPIYLPSWYARNLGHNDLAEYLKPYESTCSSQRIALSTCIRSGNVAGFQEQLGTCPHLLRYRDHTGATLLHEAAESGRKEVVEYLLNCGAKPGWRKRCGDTLLQSAVQGGNIEIVRLFLKLENNVNAKGINGRTPLFYAPSVEMAELLLRAGADVNTVDSVHMVPVMWVPIPVAEYLLANGAKLAPDKAETLLHAAARNGDKPRVELLLAHGADVNATDGPLIAAAKGGHNDIVQLLEQHGAREPEQLSLGVAGDGLRNAAVEGDLGKVKSILSSQPDAVNLTNGVGYSALMLAAANGKLEIVDLLLAHGADVNAEDRLVGRTPLHWAITSGRVRSEKIVEILLAHHPDIETKDNTGNTPLFEAAQAGSAEMTAMLLASGANVAVTNNLGRTLQQIASGAAVEVLKQTSKQGIAAALSAKALRDAVKAGDTQTVRRLLAENADIVNEPDEAGRPPLLLTSSPQVMEILLKNKADPNVADRDRFTALHYAARAADSNLTALLLANGAEPTPKCNTWTPLHFAVLGPSADIDPAKYATVAELLVKHGAKVNATANFRQAPLHLAAWYGRTKAAELLLANGADTNLRDANGETALLTAARAGKPEIIKLLLAGKSEMETRSKDGRTPLLIASASGSIESVEALLAAGADSKAVTPDGANSLHLAASAPVAKALLDRGLTPTALDKKKKTPLHYASSAGRADVLEALLKTGCDVDVQDDRGWTPLHEAAAAGQAATARILLTAKANPSFRANDGETPLHVSTKQELVDLLLAHGADIHALTSDGSTPADTARRANRIDMATYLQQRAQVSAKSP